MTLLRVAVSSTPLCHEWEHLRTALRRGARAPEASPIPLDQYHPASIDAAKRAWARRMADEHRSATVFSALLPQLIEAEAPLDFQGVVLRMAMEELRHGELCGDVVSALGGEAEVEVDLVTETVAIHAGQTARVRALRNVIYASCISETVSVSLTTAERGHTEEPFVCAVIDQLLGDEILHARFGWLYLGIALERLEPAEKTAVEAYLPFALRHYVERVSPGRTEPEARERQVQERQVQERQVQERLRLGLGPGELYQEILEDTLDEVVVPRLRDHGLKISAWK